MQQDKIKAAIKERREMLKMLKKIGEDKEVIEMVTKLEYEPVQSLAERYKYVKISKAEKNFKYFKIIAQFLADKFYYSVQNHCYYYGSTAYDFELILSLARFYKKNKTLFDGHMDIIKRMSEGTCGWLNLKCFWLSNTIGN